MGDAQIFIAKEGKLERLVEARYDTEDRLQSLLANHPELLAGEQIDDEDPRRWLLVGREVGIADGDGAADRWSIDHIFIDQDAIPTFVEVKRSSDPRIRREVVGQLVEYVANAARFWPPNHLQTVASATAKRTGKAVEEAVHSLVHEVSADAATFWSRVDQNLREGKVRLMFVADKIPPELRRMAEFLNDQMTHTEVLAVEVRKYNGGASGLSAFVPYVRNVSPRAREVKATSHGRKQWTEADFVEHLKRIADPSVLHAAEKVFRELKVHATTVYYGSGRAPSFNPRLPGIGPGSPVTLKPDGSLIVNYGYIGGKYGDLEEGSRGLQQRNALAQKFGSLVGEVPADEKVARYPSYDGPAWAPYADALVAALREIGSSPSL